jgi:hypothetical protein
MCFTGSFCNTSILVFYEYIPCAEQEWHNRSSVCQWQPTSSTMLRCPGSVSSAVGSALFQPQFYP